MRDTAAPVRAASFAENSAAKHAAIRDFDRDGSGARLGVSAAEPVSPSSSDIAPAKFADLPRFRSYRTHRSSSADPSGGNADYRSIEPGATANSAWSSRAGNGYAYLVHDQLQGGHSP